MYKELKGENVVVELASEGKTTSYRLRHKHELARSRWLCNGEKENIMATCQALYDLREKYEFCSGTDLHDFFRSAVGEPSPSGYAEVNGARALKFVERCCDAMAWNSPSLAEHCEKTKKVARRKLAAG